MSKKSIIKAFGISADGSMKKTAASDGGSIGSILGEFFKRPGHYLSEAFNSKNEMAAIPRLFKGDIAGATRAYRRAGDELANINRTASTWYGKGLSMFFGEPTHRVMSGISDIGLAATNQPDNVGRSFLSRFGQAGKGVGKAALGGLEVAILKGFGSGGAKALTTPASKLLKYTPRPKGKGIIRNLGWGAANTGKFGLNQTIYKHPILTTIGASVGLPMAGVHMGDSGTRMLANNTVRQIHSVY